MLSFAEGSILTNLRFEVSQGLRLSMGLVLDRVFQSMKQALPKTAPVASQHLESLLVSLVKAQ